MLQFSSFVLSVPVIFLIGVCVLLLCCSWKVEQELQEAGIDDLVSSARQVVTRLYDEGEMNNTPRVPDDEKELEALALEAVALLTEKMHYGGEIDIDQRAYVQLAIVAPNGQDHYRIQVNVLICVLPLFGAAVCS